MFKLSILFICAVRAHFAERYRRAGDGSSWDYKKQGDDWGTIDAKCTGARQSPIDLPDSSETPLTDPFNIEVQSDLPLDIGNNGHSIKFSPKEGSSILSSVTGGYLPFQYDFLQFHFHWGSETEGGSEHTLEGKRFFAELHSVHFKEGYSVDDALSKADGLAVLGVFVEVSEDSDFEEGPFDKLIQDVIGKSVVDPGAKHEVTMSSADYMAIFGRTNDDFYRYDGSLTTPTCNPVVTWTVFKTPLFISTKTRDAMITSAKINAEDTTFLEKNYRSLQPLNDRKVTFYSTNDPAPSVQQNEPPSDDKEESNALTNAPFTTPLITFIIILLTLFNQI